MRKETKKTNEFITKTPDGKKIIIYEFTDYLNAGSFNNHYSKVEGLKSYFTTDGNHVNRINENEYQIVETGVILQLV